MSTSSRRPASFKDLPAEFFLPPQTQQELWKETTWLLALCFGFIAVLAIAVVFTQGIVVQL